MNNDFGFKNISLDKCLLFLNAYSPILLIISIKAFFYKIHIFGIPVSIISLILFFIMVYYSYYLIKKSKKGTNKYFVINKVDEKTDIILSYFIPYLIAVISLGTLDEIISALVIFLFIFLIYSNSEILYINPIFMLFGYKFYHIYTEKSYVLILSKQDLYRSIGETIMIKQLSTRLYILNGD